MFHLRRGLLEIVASWASVCFGSYLELRRCNALLLCLVDTNSLQNLKVYFLVEDEVIVASSAIKFR